MKRTILKMKRKDLITIGRRIVHDNKGILPLLSYI
jgi:hypothetical protein